MFHRVRPILHTAIVLLPIIASSAVASSPSTAPSNSPADLKTAVARLSDRDPSVRGAAREQLMELSPTDLPTLRAAVEEARPLPPGEAEAIHEIVLQLFLAGENASGDISQGFMGIRMSELQPFGTENNPSDTELSMGVIVDSRLPGFDAYRGLRDGDIIVAIAAEGDTAKPVFTAEVIKDTVAKLPAGQRVQLQVVRHGRHVETTLTLGPRPGALDKGAQIDAFDLYRQDEDKKAQAFWLERFASVVEDSVS